ncbi:MAG: NYN domain-containing protein, partial [Vitreimonas sp.]
MNENVVDSESLRWSRDAGAGWQGGPLSSLRSIAARKGRGRSDRRMVRRRYAIDCTHQEMTAQFARGPQTRTALQQQNAPHAALLIDFDNVTMGIRSDLTKELKNLLNSDIIKGKVAVQRAYADWRRYPQYIVPLAENSVDLIFAPAYGSSKKNATDIRLAIDALELVFTRAEIGTFILLSGDSDFSSLVLKLKEYGKYVIGVGIRESSSDLLVQNCDEYYSYSGLTGLTRAGDEPPGQVYDPWELVEVAVRQMVEQRDVMRSDRLKQILLELDPNFDEKTLGFNKFNRFLQEAATRGQLHLKKMENGQYEVGPAEPALPPLPPAAVVEPPAPRRARSAPPRTEPRPETQRAESRPETPRPEIKITEPAPVVPAPAAPQPEVKIAAEAVPALDGLDGAYELLQRATADLGRGKGSPIRDSDVKRRMLELRPGFDEGTYGFSKFSRFLRQAHDAEVINLQKVENGSFEVSPGAKASHHRGSARVAVEPAATPATDGAAAVVEKPRRGGRDRGRRGREPRERPASAQKEVVPAVKPDFVEVQAEQQTQPKERKAAPAPPARSAAEPVSKPSVTPAAAAPAAVSAPAPAPYAPSAAPGAGKPGVSLGFRRGSRGGAPASAPPPILAGQTISPARDKPVVAQPEPAPAQAANAEEPARRGRTRSAAAPARTDGKTRARGDGQKEATPVTLDQLTLPRT